jgi:hypothetical protein
VATIIPNQTFKHGRETYQKGESYEVSAEEAYYFKMCGWLEPDAVKVAGENMTLDVHDSQFGHASEVK